MQAIKNTHNAAKGSLADSLLLHGFLGGPEDWQEFRKHCQLRSFAATLPGHGTGGTAPVGNLPYTAISCAGVWRDSCVAKPLLIGYSLGGRFALEMALAEPEQWSALVLISTGTGISDSLERTNRLALDQQRAAEIKRDYAGFLKRWYTLPLFAGLGQRRDFPALLIRRQQAVAPALAAAIEKFSPGVNPCRHTEIKSLALPILVLYGEKDQKYSRLAQVHWQKLPQVVVVGIPGAGHALLEEAGENVARQVLQFVKQVKAHERVDQYRINHQHR